MRMITMNHFLEVDARVGKIVSVEDHPGAKKPSYRLKVDFGPYGTRKAVGEFTTYSKEELTGKKVIGVINFAPLQNASFIADSVVLSIQNKDGKALLPELPESAEVGSRLV